MEETQQYFFKSKRILQKHSFKIVSFLSSMNQGNKKESEGTF